MIKIVGVRFKNAGKIYYFDPVELEVEKSIDVVVETARGLEYGTVVVGPKEIDESELVSPLKPIIRIATDEDRQVYLENKEKAKETFELCQQKIKEHDLNMFLIDCEYTFDRNKLIFYFTAEGRIDFRELVKDLASVFRTRIELRQIGVRDEVKRIGGNGVCGRELCCCTFLNNFETVSIKMAKEQNIALNPSKISGNCGRLMCCLKYEQDVYSEKLSRLPKVGALVKTESGEGTVESVEVLKEVLKVKIKDGDDYTYKKFDAKDVKVIKDSKNNNVIDEEEKQNLKELQELEKLEKMDQKNKSNDDEI